MLFIDLAYCAGCLGVVGVRGDILVLKWDGAYIDGACVDETYMDRACTNKVCINKACGIG